MWSVTDLLNECVVVGYFERCFLGGKRKLECVGCLFGICMLLVWYGGFVSGERIVTEEIALCCTLILCRSLYQMLSIVVGSHG